MKNFKLRLNFKIAFLAALLIFSGCTTTFGGSVVVFRFWDFVNYTLIALTMGVLCALTSKKENRLKQFWTWFILSVFLTPLSGLICFIILFTRKRMS
jgi:hypothetical protein